MDLLRFGRKGLSIMAVVAGLAAIEGCGAKAIDPIAGKDFRPEVDEQQMWERADKIDVMLRDADLVHDDPALQSYLEATAARLLPHLAAEGAKFRIHVLEDPFLNAFALPNGSIYLHTGLLAALDDEAQLAMVLGHELTHYLRRHGLRSQRNQEKQQMVARIVVSVVAMSIPIGGVAVLRTFEAGGVSGRDFVEAQVAGYARELEQEADQMALSSMSSAGYDPAQSVGVFEALKAEAVSEGIEEPYLYGRYPTLDERLASCRTLLADRGSRPASLDNGAAPYAAAIDGLLLENTRMNLRISRPRRARVSIERYLASHQDSVDGWLLLGEVWRRSGDQPENLRAAREVYERVIRIAPGETRAYRELGLLERQMGDLASSRRHFLQYLDQHPNAPDKAVIEGYLYE